ncbi:beta-N-acetylglucosaminidase domain-containing protein [Streptomyces iconiensis]|uniref:Beta-N-acetylglucosaminidase domain-containing protein n=1 Tax=Streptomyces iconiensis TaxID=1384038 RepID=A0ABT7A5H5_9ACTN|nr:beta-N-acetylglucosaminidase domain-containing protein [Streptomyces iconiensis]MDJ1136598.1 beta-N-acetylglucosaminidase domain-containing protein [Streptomyces iconiensis]
MSAAVLTAAVVGGLLGGTPAAHAAPPPSPDDPSAGSPDDDSARGSLPPVWPRPQSMREQGAFTRVGPEVVLVADEDADRYALDVLRGTLRDAGVRTVHEAHPGDTLPGQPRGKGQSGREKRANGQQQDGDRQSGQWGGGPGAHSVVVRVGEKSAGAALRALRAPERGDLPRGGYRLATGTHDGRDTVALEGADGEGLFYAAQTLRQLLTERGGSHGFPGVAVRDWPTAAARGTTEGFYGQPWSHEERLSQIDFLGRTKQNRYLYAPGDDPYRQSSRWRDPYPAAERAAFRQLAERAKRNHVVLGWAVSPGQGLCFSSEEDRKALLRKVDAMWALGVRSFQLRFEDVSYSEWHCGDDADKYGSGPESAARAQAELSNAVAEHLSSRHPEAEPLSVMPTEFYQKGRTAYRKALAGELNDRVHIGWSGVGVVPRTISGGELAGARAAFPHHGLVTMDNYPVNDFAQDRIFLGPYRGREPAVATGSAAVLTNAMKQPTASRIPLFTAADYAWNPRGYRPQESWKAAIDEVAGGPGAAPRTRAAVHALAENDASSVLDSEESAYLRPLLDAFWKAYKGGDGASLESAGRRLRAAFGTMRTAPSRVPAQLAGEVRPWLEELARLGEAGERSVDMLLAQSRHEGAAAWEAQLDVRRLRGESARAKATVGKGVLTDFADKALRVSDEWTGVTEKSPGGKPKNRPESEGESKKKTEEKGGEKSGKSSESGGATRGGGGPDGSGGRDALTVTGTPDALPGSPLSAVVDGDPDTVYRAAGTPSTAHFLRERPPMLVPPNQADGAHTRAAGDTGAAREETRSALTVRLPEPRRLRAVTVLSGPRSGTRAHVEVHLPGKGWKRLGALSDTGWTQLPSTTAQADAVRLTWANNSEPPVVHEVTPWYADGPDTSLALPRTTVDAAIGGGPTRAHARLTGHRPADARGKVTAKAPKGFTVRTPLRTTVRQGSTVDVPLRITADSSVKPGSYGIPVSFDGERTTLTVRAYPRTSGPDLAREGSAKSSGDETDDFPASAAIDGKRGTRWSSPAKDGEWVQVELPERTRVGRVVLRWQDAYASRYRVQVSPDGKRWRTAATVRESKGGRESVRMDSPRDTRFVRVQGDERATRFGISLYSFEVYAVDTGKGAHAGQRSRPENERPGNERTKARTGDGTGKARHARRTGSGRGE